MLIFSRTTGDDGSDGGVGTRVLSTFLNELDGISNKSRSGASKIGDVLVIVACSKVASLDEALTRPGRLQHHFELGTLTHNDVTAIVNTQLLKFPKEIEVEVTTADVVSMIE